MLAMRISPATHAPRTIPLLSLVCHLLFILRYLRISQSCRGSLWLDPKFLFLDLLQLLPPRVLLAVDVLLHSRLVRSGEMRIPVPSKKTPLASI